MSDCRPARAQPALRPAHRPLPVAVDVLPVPAGSVQAPLQLGVPDRDRLPVPVQRVARSSGRARSPRDRPAPTRRWLSLGARLDGQARKLLEVDEQIPPVAAAPVLRPAAQPGREGPPGDHQVLPRRQPRRRGHPRQARHPLHPPGRDPARGQAAAWCASATRSSASCSRSFSYRRRRQASESELEILLHALARPQGRGPGLPHLHRARRRRRARPLSHAQASTRRDDAAPAASCPSLLETTVAIKNRFRELWEDEEAALLADTNKVRELAEAARRAPGDGDPGAARDARGLRVRAAALRPGAADGEPPPRGRAQAADDAQPDPRAVRHHPVSARDPPPPPIEAESRRPGSAEQAPDRSRPRRSSRHRARPSRRTRCSRST